MSLLILPFMLLNLLAGLVGGIWLIVLGEWGTVGFGLGLSFIGTFLVGILLIPSMLVLAPIVGIASVTKVGQSPVFMGLLSVIGIGYTFCIMGIWAFSVFSIVCLNLGEEAKIPGLLWSYAASTAVWNHMAQQDARGGNEWTPMSAFFHQIGCVALMVYAWNHSSSRLPWIEMLPWYAVPMGLALIFQVFVLVVSVNESRRNQIY